MNQFLKTRLFSLLENRNERSVSALQWRKSYKMFADAVFAASEKTQRVVLHNSLLFVKAELACHLSNDALKKKRHQTALYSKGCLSC